jgi:3-mercaptopyruvate sulfurtransferase SseA
MADDSEAERRAQALWAHLNSLCRSYVPSASAASSTIPTVDLPYIYQRIGLSPSPSADSKAAAPSTSTAASVVVIDIRPADEYAGWRVKPTKRVGHIPTSFSLPLSNLFTEQPSQHHNSSGGTGGIAGVGGDLVATSTVYALLASSCGLSPATSPEVIVVDGDGDWAPLFALLLEELGFARVKRLAAPGLQPLLMAATASATAPVPAGSSSTAPAQATGLAAYPVRCWAGRRSVVSPQWLYAACEYARSAAAHAARVATAGASAAQAHGPSPLPPMPLPWLELSGSGGAFIVVEAVHRTAIPLRTSGGPSSSVSGSASSAEGFIPGTVVLDLSLTERAPPPSTGSVARASVGPLLEVPSSRGGPPSPSPPTTPDAKSRPNAGFSASPTAAPPAAPFGALLEAGALRAVFAECLGVDLSAARVAAAPTIVVWSASLMGACRLALALSIASGGRADVRVLDGGLSEWVRAVKGPIAPKPARVQPIALSAAVAVDDVKVKTAKSLTDAVTPFVSAGSLRAAVTKAVSAAAAAGVGRDGKSPNGLRAAPSPLSGASASGSLGRSGIAVSSSGPCVIDLRDWSDRQRARARTAHHCRSLLPSIRTRW